MRSCDTPAAMPTEWIPCDTPEGFDVRAYKRGEFIVAAKRVGVGFTWTLLRRLPSGEIQPVGGTFNQVLLPLLVDDLDASDALEWANNEIVAYTLFKSQPGASPSTLPPLNDE
jgi:hypothetical protein